MAAACLNYEETHMALLKTNRSITVDLQVLAGAHEVIVDYGSPARVEMTLSPARNAIQGELRMNTDRTRRLLKALSEPLPVAFRLGEAALLVEDENERKQFVRSLEHALRTASRTILEIDSPIELLKPWQQTRGEHFCTWPVRFGGRRINQFLHHTDGVVREVVEYEFVSENLRSRPAEAFKYTRSFFAIRWRDSCVGQSVLVSLRNEDREVKRVELLIGTGRNDLKQESAALAR
jgi:hypothetical protein